MDSEVQKAHDELRSFMFERVYRADMTIAEMGKASFIVEFLFNYFSENKDKLPQLYLRLAEQYGLPVAVGDFISGMTDDYAVSLFKEICLPKGWLGGAARLG